LPGLCKLASVLVFSLALLMSHAAARGFAGQQGASPSVEPKEQAQDQQRKGRAKKPAAAKKKDPAAEAKRKAAAEAKRKARADSLAALLDHLGVGEGAAVADVGAGNGQDTWTFAKIVGEEGTVFAEEIAEGKVKSLEGQAKEKGLGQVRPLLGRPDDPCLPPNTVDLAFMHHVYHHVSKPRQMLRGIWRGLKPGGYFVVVDRQRGTLRDWVPRERRAEKHFWLAETTVVREAREEGFAFVECAEELWHDDQPFVLVFQRPEGVEEPGRDPDPSLPLAVDDCRSHFLPTGRTYERPVFIALGEARKLIAPIVASSSGEALEIVLEEWATQKDERPPMPPDVSFPSKLTDSGDPQLGPEPIDAVFFLDSFHLLFHGKTLLAKLHERLAPSGCVYVLDRRASEPLSRREASHHRKIPIETVKQEMAEAGFALRSQAPQPVADRFLLVFDKTLASVAEEPGWISLFDGKSLDGWKESGAEGSFRVEEGKIVVNGKPMGHLFYQGKVENASFKDFEFKAQVTTTPGSNSGIYFHSKYQKEGFPKAGFEAQVNATHGDRRKTGGLYGVEDVMDVAPHKDDEWFEYHIIVKGESVTIKINGKTTIQWTQTEDFRNRPEGTRKIGKGTFAFQAHDPKSTVYIKNVRVKPLP
jgi:predicted methyltransferase